MKQQAFLLTALTIAALVLGACTIQVNCWRTVKEDGSGTLGWEIGLSKSDQDALSGLGYEWRAAL